MSFFLLFFFFFSFLTWQWSLALIRAERWGFMAYFLWPFMSARSTVGWRVVESCGVSSRLSSLPHQVWLSKLPSLFSHLLPLTHSRLTRLTCLILCFTLLPCPLPYTLASSYLCVLKIPHAFYGLHLLFMKFSLVYVISQIYTVLSLPLFILCPKTDTSQKVITGLPNKICYRY